MGICTARSVRRVFPAYMPPEKRLNFICACGRKLCEALRFSAELCAGGDGVVQHKEIQLFLAALGVDGGDQHAV